MNTLHVLLEILVVCIALSACALMWLRWAHNQSGSSEPGDGVGGLMTLPTVIYRGEGDLDERVIKHLRDSRKLEGIQRIFEMPHDFLPTETDKRHFAECEFDLDWIPKNQEARANVFLVFFNQNEAEEFESIFGEEILLKDPFEFQA